MCNETLRTFIRQLGGTALREQSDLPDAELLERFFSRRDEAAFEVLVWRHGPMVLSVCRRLLRHEQDTEDAFQATFLALARKAKTIAKREALGSWLYKVAYRVALRAKAKVITRAKHEKPDVNVTAVEPAPDPQWSDVRPVLDEEVVRLPGRYQATFVLFYFDGKSVAEVARQLGCPPGTVLSRLAWARERLRSRLAQRGLSLTGAMVALLLSKEVASTSVPASLVSSTVHAVQTFGVGQTTAAEVVSERIAELAQAALKPMAGSKFTAVALAALATAVTGIGVGVVYHRTPPAVPANTVLATPDHGFPDRPPLTTQDMARLQSVWTCIAFEKGGKADRTVHQKVERSTTLAIAGERLTINGRILLAFKLDPSRWPKEIDLARTEQGPVPSEGNFFLEEPKGIYSVEGDTLTICLGPLEKTRPANFETRRGDRRVLMVLQRNKP